MSDIRRIFDLVFGPPEFMRMEKIDPVAVNSVNPKEYAGEADAIEEIEPYPYFGFRAGNTVYYSGEFASAARAAPNKIVTWKSGAIRASVGGTSPNGAPLAKDYYLRSFGTNERGEYWEHWEAKTYTTTYHDDAMPTQQQPVFFHTCPDGLKTAIAMGDTCPYCEEKMPAQGHKPAPTRFASIAPHFTGENINRAPHAGDTHKCQDDYPLQIEFFRALGMWCALFGHYPGQRKESYSMQPITHCPHCGGLLPTLDLHEGSAAQEPSGFGKAFDSGDGRIHCAPQWTSADDAIAQRQKEDVEIRAFWGARENKKHDTRTLGLLLENAETVYFIYFCRYSDSGVRMSAAPDGNVMLPNWHTWTSNAAHCPQQVIRRTGAELLALLRPDESPQAKEPPKCEDCKFYEYTTKWPGGNAYCMHAKTRGFCDTERTKSANCGPSGKLFEPKDKPQPITYPTKPECLVRDDKRAGWVAVEDGLPDEFDIVQVKVVGDLAHESHKIFGQYVGGGMWQAQRFGRGLVVKHSRFVTHWRRIE